MKSEKVYISSLIARTTNETRVTTTYKKMVMMIETMSCLLMDARNTSASTHQQPNRDGKNQTEYVLRLFRCFYFIYFYVFQLTILFLIHVFFSVPFHFFCRIVLTTLFAHPQTISICSILLVFVNTNFFRIGFSFVSSIVRNHLLSMNR